jgi:hypothetical protein
MTKLIVDATLPEKLPGLVHPVQLCDADGRALVEYFPRLDPAVSPEAADDPWEQILCDPTPRPALAQRKKEVEEEIASGQARPLDM